MAKEKTNGEAAVGEAAAKAPKEKFYFPDLDRTIEADSFEDAVAIANKELNRQ